jgi:4-amino-4-deoxy-L-arabinose transferase-like glycosyltransferase
LGRGGSQGGFGGPGGGGGFLNSSQSNAALDKLLQADASRYTWAAATVNSNSAAGYQLGSGEPVMAIGGFNGSDPTPTLAQFEKYVAEGKIHYFIAGSGGFGGGGLGGGTNDASQITSWVEAHFNSETVGGVTVYNLTTAAS